MQNEYDKFGDDEVISAEDFDQLVDVWDDCVTVRLPDCAPLLISDDELDYLFNHPEEMSKIVDPEHFDFFMSFFPAVLRIRNLKRGLYEELGFSS
jgi:hypothetical protein